MTQANLFRLFVGLSIAFGIAGAAVDYCFTGLLSEDLANALENEPSTGIVYEHPFVSLAILIPWLIAAVVGVVGFFLFKPWGRALSLYTSVLGVFITPFLGSFAASGLSSTLSETSFTLWGAALAMAYFSSASERFDAKNR